MSSSMRFITYALGMNFYLNDRIRMGKVAEYIRRAHLGLR